MLPLSPTSNDSSLRHKPTLASDGLDRCSRPFSGVQKVCLPAVCLTRNDRAWPTAAGLLSALAPQNRTSLAAQAAVARKRLPDLSPCLR